MALASPSYCLILVWSLRVSRICLGVRWWALWGEPGGGGAYHHVGAVEDEGKEEGEATEVHVALGIELAGLNLHALVSENGSA